ncbi:Enhancer of polycomb-like protein 1 [Gnomoniopsis sp. IMI 355080]|nr:Enhancer of polycomb-like protein 1 [Gnomoniopsis sp. IMI 355080]
MATRKVRVKKLNPKAPLDVLTEDEIDASEYAALTQELSVATGVDAAEEKEVHLQNSLASEHNIPVPPPQASDLNYDELYASGWKKPANYIRFSSTVEDSIGCPYDMTEEDEAFLKAYNAKYPPSQQLSEDDFERIMDVFEETASLSTPYAAVDKTIAPYSDMVSGLARLGVAMPHTNNLEKELYEYWRSRREACDGPLHPMVKFETHQDTDDLDPYICFRRREIRQTRKTRARDVQSADKLKRLRRELETGRSLIIESCERELLKKDMLQVEKEVFETRASLRDMKVRLGIKTNDTDLWNQKEEPPVKKRSQESSSAQRAAANAVRLGPPRNPSAQAVEVDLVQLEAQKQKHEDELRRDILTKIENHHKWNRHHVDLTKSPLPPVRSPTRKPFRAAQAQYLLTPPASSASQESLEEPEPMDLDDPDPPAVFHFRGALVDENDPPKIAFRRRIGRLNRLWIDRRTVPHSPPRDPQDIDPWKQSQESDRWKYDQDDSEGEQPVYEVDPYDTRCIRFRATIPLGFGDARRPQRPVPPALIQAAQMDPAAAQQAAMQAAAAAASARQGASAQKAES